MELGAGRAPEPAGEPVPGTGLSVVRTGLRAGHNGTSLDREGRCARGPEWPPLASGLILARRRKAGQRGLPARLSQGGAPSRGGTVGQIGLPIWSSQREHGGDDLDAVRPSPRLLKTAANTPPPSSRRRPSRRREGDAPEPPGAVHACSSHPRCPPRRPRADSGTRTTREDSGAHTDAT